MAPTQHFKMCPACRQTAALSAAVCPACARPFRTRNRRAGFEWGWFVVALLIWALPFLLLDHLRFLIQYRFWPFSP